MPPISQEDRLEIARSFRRVASLNPVSPPKLYVKVCAQSFIDIWERRLMMEPIIKAGRSQSTARQASKQLQRFQAALEKFDAAYDSLSGPAFDAIANTLDEEGREDWGLFDVNDLLYFHAFYVRILSDAIAKAAGTIEIGAPERSAPRKATAHRVVANLADIYERLSGRRPGITVPTDTSTTGTPGVAEGAFLDMIRAAFGAFGIKASPKAMYDSYASTNLSEL